MSMDDAINKAVSEWTPERIAGMARLAKQQNDRLEKRKPLTLGQKQKLWSSVGYKPTLKDRVNAYGLAIEAAHGITNE